MRRPRSYQVVLVIILLALFGSGIGQASPREQRRSAPIWLKSGVLTPDGSDLQRAQPELTLSDYARGQRGYYLVQFRGPVEEGWKGAVEALGAEILEYIPDFTFKVRMDRDQATQVRSLAEVAWVGIFQPAYKFAPSQRAEGVAQYRVRIERGSDIPAALAALTRSGAALVQDAQGDLIISADAKQLEAVARVLDIAWIERFEFFEKHNDVGGGTIIKANIAHSRAYDGSTQIAAVADTGIGGGTAATAHADIPSTRVQAIQNFPGANSASCYSVVNDGAADVDSGHGTHVAVSVVGGGMVGGTGKGVAPAAKLVFQAVENWVNFHTLCASEVDGYYLIGIPTDLRTLFQQAYNAGARIHSNSWGSDALGDYTANSAYADEFIWTNPDMTITFSAGNSGKDANANGEVDVDSIGAPATAKNVITIGASENQRASYPCDTALTYNSLDAYQPSTTCTGMGGNNILGTYGVRWPASFPANPIASDPSAGNSQQMAGFSSRGPTDDNRIKPDVVAPGTWILSGYSSQYRQGYSGSPNPQNGAYQSDGWGMPMNGTYKYFGGTSMSNPLAGGAATVVRDFYKKTANVDASAALVKATLINSAVDLLDENNDGANDNDYPIPNHHEGWGLIDLDNATDGSAKYIDATTGVSTSGAVTYSASVSGGTPLKISLVWSDYPSTAAAAINLVNDLDLEVTAPGGTIYRGNVFSGGWSATGGSADRRNNVENVYISSAAAGTWTVTVRGFNVPNGPQRYALVVDGATALTVPTPTNTGLLNPTANASETGGDNNGFQTSPTNAYTNNATFAVDTNSGSGTSTSCTNSAKDKHRFYNYGVSIPGGSTVDGVTVRLDARADATGGAPFMCVQLSWDGGTSWTAAKSTPTLTTSEATYLLGGPTDTWGRAWSISDFSNANFRVRVINVASNTSRDFSLDWVAVQVDY